MGRLYYEKSTTMNQNIVDLRSSAILDKQRRPMVEHTTFKRIFQKVKYMKRESVPDQK